MVSLPPSEKGRVGVETDRRGRKENVGLVAYIFSVR